MPCLHPAAALPVGYPETLRADRRGSVSCPHRNDPRRDANCTLRLPDHDTGHAAVDQRWQTCTHPNGHPPCPVPGHVDQRHQTCAHPSSFVLFKDAAPLVVERQTCARRWVGLPCRCRPCSQCCLGVRASGGLPDCAHPVSPSPPHPQAARSRRLVASIWVRATRRAMSSASNTSGSSARTRRRAVP